MNDRNDDILIEAQGVSKSYKEGPVETVVLRDLSISIPRGSFTAITGKSGVGKSTLLHLLGLIDRPSSGDILYLGRNTRSLSRKETARIRNREFGFVFQSYHLINELSALENVLVPAMMVSPWRWLAGRSELKERARALLERVGLSERTGHRPLQLSGGERQRVAIARALVNRPKALFCDEPTGNLDEKTSDSIFQLILDLHRQEGLTLVIVTHEQRYARQAQFVYKLHAGKAEKVEPS